MSPMAMWLIWWRLAMGDVLSPWEPRKESERDGD